MTSEDGSEALDQGDGGERPGRRGETAHSVKTFSPGVRRDRPASGQDAPASGSRQDGPASGRGDGLEDSRSMCGRSRYQTSEFPTTSEFPAELPTTRNGPTSGRDDEPASGMGDAPASEPFRTRPTSGRADGPASGARDPNGTVAGVGVGAWGKEGRGRVEGADRELRERLKHVREVRNCSSKIVAGRKLLLVKNCC